MPTAADLVAALRQTGLLPPAQLGEVTRDLLGRFPDGRALAAELLRRGWLTAYQVNQLLQGRGDRLVLGSYHLLEPLGEGGMGQVFKARHSKLGRVVAVKVIRKERLGRPDAVRRFRREIEAAAQLSHPNIVLALDADQAGDTHFFAMEYVAGTDLHQHVEEHGPLPVRQACEHVRQAALGLQHAHERGLVHRDIKPHNLLLKLPQPSSASEATADGTSAGMVKILDMGLARFRREGDSGESSSTLTQEGALMGTVDYISPEQARDSRAVDIRADLYSLGCTLYFLLAGQVPFPGGAATGKLLRHQLEEPTPVEHLRPDTPPRVAAVVRKLMAKKPEDRFRTPAELAQVLTGILREDDSRAPAAPVASPRDGTVVGQGPALSPFADLEDVTEAVAPPPSAGPRTAVRRTVWMVGLGAGIGLALAMVFAVVLINSLGGARPAGPGQKQSPRDPRQHMAGAAKADGPPRALSAEEARKQQEDEAERLGVPVQVTNSIGMKLNLIPAGRFLMGSPESEPGRQPNEGPRHEVTMTRPLLIGVYEVRQAEYEKVTGKNPAKFNKQSGGGPNYPVEMVSWDDAVACCRKLSELPEEKKAGRAYRLPTEAEWEYACRAGTQTAYHFGDDLKLLPEFGWAATDLGAYRSHPVGLLKPNAWGLFDVHGNVMEWCSDGETQRAGENASPRPVRGGPHLGYGEIRCRAAYRCSVPGAYPNIGFRVVCEVQATAEQTKDSPR